MRAPLLETLACYGFRPFFLAAGLFAATALGVWFAVYSLHFDIALNTPPLAWHAHEMVFGYGGAVMAGFLLTAVRNWTGLPTLSGAPLLALAGVWLVARVLPFFPEVPLALLASFDVGFYVALVSAIACPIVRAKNWSNLGVVAKIALIMLSNLLYYFGLFELVTAGSRMGLYAGFYLLVGLLLMMLRRLIPFFTERGVGYPVTLPNSSRLDVAALVLFLAFWAIEVLAPGHVAGSWLAGTLALLHGSRGWGWRTRGVLKKPLLWVLYAGYALITVGFALRAVGPLLSLSPFLAVHTFAVGGVGVVTLGMMARIALGHTGRDVHHAPVVVGPMFGLLLGAFVARVVLPALAGAHYAVWIGLSELLWIAAFGLFVVAYAPILVGPRADGRPG